MDIGCNINMNAPFSPKLVLCKNTNDEHWNATQGKDVDIGAKYGGKMVFLQNDANSLKHV
jgi:hypothetical protein